MKIVDWWYGIVDNWFALTTAIGVVVLIGAVIVSAIKALHGAKREHSSPDAPGSGGSTPPSA